MTRDGMLFNDSMMLYLLTFKGHMESMKATSAHHRCQDADLRLGMRCYLALTMLAISSFLLLPSG